MRQLRSLLRWSHGDFQGSHGGFPGKGSAPSAVEGWGCKYLVQSLLMGSHGGSGLGKGVLGLVSACALLGGLGAQPLLASVQPDLPLPVRIHEQQRVQHAEGRDLVPQRFTPLVQPAPEQEDKAHAPKGATTLSAAFPDGMTLLAWRGGEGSEALDPFVRVRNQQGQWLEPLRVGREGWKATGPGSAHRAAAMSNKGVPGAVQAPSADTHGEGGRPDASIQGGPAQPWFDLSISAPRATLSWYSEPDGEARVLVSQTPDAGLRWTAAMRADLGSPEGRVATATLSSGTILVVWFERAQGDDPSLPGGLYLRRYAPNGASAMPALLALVDPDRTPGALSVALESETSDGASGVLHVGFGEGANARLLRVELPTRQVLDDLDQSCRCGPAREPGVPLRARIKTLDTKTGEAVLTHGEVPGLLRPGELPVLLELPGSATLKVGDEVLARIERAGKGWRLLGPRVIGVVR